LELSGPATGGAAMSHLLDFLAAATPTWIQVLIGVPASLAWAASCLSFAGWLKRQRKWRTGYTRKTFHFLVFFTVAILQAACGLPLVCVFGSMTSLVVFYAVWRSDEHPWYEAMAREKDAPHRTYFILAPYFATLIGGVAGNILFGHSALLGYLVAGFGDAIGEPVGTRWGRHRYRVPSFGGVVSQRSLEGSLAVFLASIVAIIAGHYLGGNPAPAGFPAIVGIAGLCTAVEAVSPHGWDNATMQLVPAALATWWLPA
jgi:phytol kinase